MEGNVIEEKERTPKIEAMAIICHEINRVYSQSLGDFSIRCWAESSIEQKESVMFGVERYILNRKKGEVVSPERQSHDEWIAHKKGKGWKYGKEKNEQEKTHPCLVAYDDLPVCYQTKAKFFVTLCKYLNLMWREEC